MAASKEIFEKALSLKPLEKAALVGKLLSSLDQPTKPSARCGRERQRAGSTPTSREAQSGFA